MTGYVLYCTVCKVNYSNIRFWNRHLVDVRHQQNGRRELPQWDVEGRKSGIVIFSSFPLIGGNGSAEMIIDYFSKSGGEGGRVLVTDLVLSWSRPRTAILQFESKRIVNRILTAADNGPSIQLDNQMVQLRRLRKLMELEWEELLLNFRDVSIHPPSLMEMEITGNCTGLLVPQLQLQPTNPLTNEENLIINSSIEGSIRPQFQSILKEMEIPDEEFNLVLQVAREVQRVLEETLPPCKVLLYRHNYLKLRNNFQSNTYFLFMHTTKDKSGEEFQPLLMNNVSLLMKHLDSQNPWSILSHFGTSVVKTRRSRCRILHFTHLRLEHQLQLIVSFFPPSFSELQLSQLTTYYCEFDTRVKPLFALLFYWAKINQICIGDDTNILGNQTFRLAPDPVALEWLLLFFLCRHGGLLPTPQEILDRSHHLISLKSDEDQNDFGFNFDLEFAQSWKNKKAPPPPEEGSPHFVCSVLELLQKFFHFFGEELSPPCVLRLRDAQVFIKEGNIPSAYLKLGGSGGKEEVSKFSIIHPFADQWRLTVNYERWEDSVRPKMKATAGKLGAYVKALKYWIFKTNTAPFLSQLRRALDADEK